MAQANVCRAKCSFSSDPSGARQDGIDWQSIMNSSFFEKEFVDSLVVFMHEAFSLIDRVHQESNRSNVPVQMTEQERQQKMQELMQRIAVKEMELSQLEAEKRGMLSNYDPSLSSNSGGSGFSPPRMGVRTLPQRSPQPQSATYQSSIYDCDQSCDGDCSQSESGYSRYTGSTRSGPQMPARRVVTSTPVRRGTKPPAFGTSGYDSSYLPECCQTGNDSTMARWQKQLRVNPYH